MAPSWAENGPLNSVPSPKFYPGCAPENRHIWSILRSMNSIKWFNMQKMDLKAITISQQVLDRKETYKSVGGPYRMVGGPQEQEAPLDDWDPSSSSKVSPMGCGAAEGAKRGAGPPSAPRGRRAAEGTRALSR